jgi:hypothetical protein
MNNIRFPKKCRHLVKVFTKKPRYQWSTVINGNVGSVSRYYLGNVFNVGSNDRDLLKKPCNVVFFDPDNNRDVLSVSLAPKLIITGIAVHSRSFQSAIIVNCDARFMSYPEMIEVTNQVLLNFDGYGLLKECPVSKGHKNFILAHKNDV